MRRLGPCAGFALVAALWAAPVRADTSNIIIDDTNSLRFGGMGLLRETDSRLALNRSRGWAGFLRLQFGAWGDTAGMHFAWEPALGQDRAWPGTESSFVAATPFEAGFGWRSSKHDPRVLVRGGYVWDWSSNVFVRARYNLGPRAVEAGVHLGLGPPLPTDPRFTLGLRQALTEQVVVMLEGRFQRDVIEHSYDVMTADGGSEARKRNFYGFDAQALLALELSVGPE